MRIQDARALGLQIPIMQARRGVFQLADPLQRTRHTIDIVEADLILIG